MKLKATAFACLIMGMISCTKSDDNITEDVLTVQLTANKWYHYTEEIYDLSGNIEYISNLNNDNCDAFDYILLKEDYTKYEVLYDDYTSNCEVHHWGGTWSYDQHSQIITLIDEDEDEPNGTYTIKAQLINVNSRELRIRILQDGDDTDFDEELTIWTFKSTPEKYMD